MPSCLGIYIEEHLIKYAKVSKEHENIKVEAFGIKFYDKIGDAISQVIEETYSQKTWSVNPKVCALSSQDEYCAQIDDFEIKYF